MKGGIVAPKYFWKAICDPDTPAVPGNNTSNGQSIVFVARNNIGDIDIVHKKKGCSGHNQTRMNGVILCYSLQQAQDIFAAEDFKLPPFSATCNPTVRGSFMDALLNTLK